MGHKRRGGYTFLQPKPLGRAMFASIRFVRYLDTEDAFVVELESGETYRLNHARLREANRLPGATGRSRLSLDRGGDALRISGAL